MFKITKLCVIIIIGILIFLIIGELICRMFVLSNDTLPVDFISDRYLPYRLKPNSRVVSLQGIPIQTNSLGLRDYEYPIKKESGVYRILVLGDSATLGHGVRMEEVYCKKLENMLNELGRGRFEVVNAGINGYNTKDELQYLVHYGLKLDPNMILLGLMANDFTLQSLNLQIRDGVGIELGENLKINPKIKRLLRKSHLYVFLAWAYVQGKYKFRKKNRSPNEVQSYFRNTWPAYSGIFYKLIKLCQENRIDLILVYLPAREEVIKGKCRHPQWIEKIRDDQGDKYRFIDMLPYFVGVKNTKDANNLYAKKDPAHPSEKGHQLIAERIFSSPVFQERIIKKESIIDENSSD